MFLLLMEITTSTASSMAMKSGIKWRLQRINDAKLLSMVFYESSLLKVIPLG